MFCVCVCVWIVIAFFSSRYFRIPRRFAMPWHGVWILPSIDAVNIIYCFCCWCWVYITFAYTHSWYLYNWSGHRCVICACTMLCYGMHTVEATTVPACRFYQIRDDGSIDGNGMATMTAIVIGTFVLHRPCPMCTVQFHILS